MPEAIKQMTEAVPRITVFTPTYNRGILIERLYASLRQQSFRCFEWVVVDDGSQDDTAQRFARMQNEENDFPIRYLKTRNGGKHRAVNLGVQEARGELFYIVDSDDFLPGDALERIDRIEKTISPEARSGFGGICGLKEYEDHRIIGTFMETEPLDITMLQREQYGITGDKAEVFYTELLRNYPFPAFEGENFLTEGVVWDRIAADGYRLRFTKDVLMTCAYQPDGLSAGIQRLHAENPRGYGLYLSQRVRLGLLKGREKWERYLDYYYVQRKRMNLRTMAENLHCRQSGLWLGLTAMRIWQRITEQ